MVRIMIGMILEKKKKENKGISSSNYEGPKLDKR